MIPLYPGGWAVRLLFQLEAFQISLATEQNRTEQNRIRTEYEHEYKFYSQRYSGLEFMTVVDVFLFF
jgi:hypothetical protein